MRLLRVDPANIDPAIIAEAATILKRGGLVAFPTETVYGLGADATNALAVDAIFSTKGRPSYNPLIVHVRNVTEAMGCVTAWPTSAQTLAQRFWPGPLTIVLPKHPRIPDIVSASLPTVGVRVPSHPVALALLYATELPIAAPSANRSMELSPTTGGHVAASFGDAAGMILDAGPVSVGIESTVIDLSAAVPTILRPGMISVDDLERVLGHVTIASTALGADEARPSPGMMDRHYSPSARLVVSRSPGLDAILDATSAERARGLEPVVLARSAIAPGAFTVWSMPESAAEYARVLYSTLHRVDAEGYAVVVIEALPEGSEWAGLRDRVSRAAR